MYAFGACHKIRKYETYLRYFAHIGSLLLRVCGSCEPQSFERNSDGSTDFTTLATCLGVELCKINVAECAGGVRRISVDVKDEIGEIVGRG